MNKIIAKSSIVLVFILIICSFTGCRKSPVVNKATPSLTPSQTASPKVTSDNQITPTESIKPDTTENAKPTNTSQVTDTYETASPVITEGDLKVHFIDVGQGDSIFIEQGENTMLIDAGENNKGTVVTKYLNSLHIDQIDYVVGTHPHSDHIGGLDTVINAITVSNAIIPDKEHTTKTYEDFIDALIDKEVTAIPAKAGDKYTLGSATFEILSPIRDNYKDLNDWSVVIKLTFGEKSFLFTGDAETLVETDMINNGCNLSADVLKVGHHGSTTSTSKAFLSKVSPAYAIISCAEENSYGHPHDETIDLLNSKNITIYGTYKSGTIIATCDGKTISFKTEK